MQIVQNYEEVIVLQDTYTLSSIIHKISQENVLERHVLSKKLCTVLCEFGMYFKD